MSVNSTWTRSLDDGLISYTSQDLPESSIAIMEEDLKCPVCYSFYEEPQVLSCSHNLCMTCLEGLIQSKAVMIMNMRMRPSSIRCPICHVETLTRGVNSPKNNFLLKGIVDKYKIIMAAHKTPVCEKHFGQPLNIFCSTDLKLICGSCVNDEEHKGHVFSEADAHHNEKRSLEDLVKESQNRHEVLSLIKTLKANKEQALYELSMASDNISAYFEDLQSTLEEQQNEVLSDQEGVKAAVITVYDPEIGKVANILTEQENTLEMAKGLYNVFKPLLFLQKIQELREKISSIQKMPLPTVTDPTESHTVTNFDVSTWDVIRLSDADKICLPAKYPQRKHSAPAKTSQSFWALYTTFMIFTLMVAALFIGLIYNPFMSFNNDVHLLGLPMSNEEGNAVGHIEVYRNQVVKVIFNLGESCQTFVMWVMKRAVVNAYTIIWRKGQEKKILLLDWEKRDIPTSSNIIAIVKPDVKSKQTQQFCPVPLTNFSNHSRANLSKRRDLQTLRSAMSHPAIHRHGHAILSYVSMAIRKASKLASNYWWFMMQKIHQLGGLCQTSILAFVEHIAELV